MIQSKTTTIGGPRVVARLMNQVKRGELEQIGMRWHSTMLPKHFERAAHGRYGYQARDVAYIRRKVRRFGQGLDLVFRGAMRDQVRRMARVTSTPKGVRVTMTGPRYLYMYRKDLNQPDKAKELTATTADEEQELSRILGDRMGRVLTGLRETETQGA